MNALYEKVTRQVSWNKDVNIDETKASLMENFTQQEIDAVVEYARMLLNKLREAGVETMIIEEAGYYGDSVHDCLCELVAHGERFVDMILGKPELAVKMFSGRNFTENFFYVLPVQEDYNTRNPEFMANWAQKELQTLLELKSEALNMYNPDYLKKQGGYDFDMAEDVLNEVINGVKDSSRSYDKVYNSTNNIGCNALYANVWNDFMKFTVID